MTSRPVRPLRIVIFASVSSPQQASIDKDSLPSQLRDGRAWAASVGGDVVATLEIPGHSRKYIFFQDAEREMPAYHQLHKLCEREAFDVLWCRARDRLGRTDALIAQIEALVANAGAEVYSALMPIPLGETSEASAIYLSAVERASAQVESVVRNRRREIGVRARVRRGLPQSWWPYGYRAIRDEDGRTIAGEFAPGEVEAVRLATNLFLAGHGIYTITVRLNETPYNPRRAKRWGMTSVHGILHNDLYAGYVRYNDLVVRSDKFPAVWDEETHRAIVRERARRRRGGRPHVLPISGLVYCAGCGRAMQATRPRARLYYRCATHARRATLGEGCPCGSNIIHADILMDATEEALLAIQDPGAREDMLNQGQPSYARLTEQQQYIRRNIKSVRQRRERLALAFSDGTMTVDVYRDADDHLVEDLDAEMTQLKAIETALASQPTVDERRVAVLDMLGEMEENPNWLREGPVEQVRTRLLCCGMRIYVRDRQIERITLSPEV